AVLLRPVDPRPPGVEKRPLPRELVVALRLEALRPRRLRDVDLEPAPRVAPERFLGVGEADLHRGGMEAQIDAPEQAHARPSRVACRDRARYSPARADVAPRGVSSVPVV